MKGVVAVLIAVLLVVIISIFFLHDFSTKSANFLFTGRARARTGTRAAEERRIAEEKRIAEEEHKAEEAEAKRQAEEDKKRAEKMTREEMQKFEQWTNRSYYFFGNSVTRGYAFELAYYLGYGVNRTMDRLEQKRLTSKGQTGEEHSFYRHGNSISFYWKNWIGLEKAFDDYPRDSCFHFSDTRECLKTRLSNATKNDLMIIGSIPINGSRYSNIIEDQYKGGTGNGTFNCRLAWCGLYWSRAAENFESEKLMDIILEAFPGKVIWHSYPFIQQELNEDKEDANPYYFLLNNVSKKACEGRDRATFLDLVDLQKANKKLYVDCIHHPPLSRHVVIKMLSYL